MHFFKKYVIKREQMPCPAAHDVLHEKPLLWNSMPFLSKLKFPDFGSQSELTRWHCDFCMTQQMTSQINRILHLRLHCIFLLINNCYIYIVWNRLLMHDTLMHIYLSHLDIICLYIIQICIAHIYCLELSVYI